MDVTFLIENTLPMMTAFALRAIAVILLLIGAWAIASWCRERVRSGLERTSLDVTLTKFFSNVTAWLIMILAVLTALSVFGIQTASFVAVIGALSLAIGLAFQGTLSNFAAGVMLLTFRPFKVGHAVNVNNQIGKVDEIDLFFTRMDTFDNRRILIPNSQVFGNTIETITFHPHRRAEVPVGVSYNADIDKTREVLEKAAASVEGRLEEPAPQVVLDNFGDSSVNWLVRVWAPTPDFVAIRQATIRAVKQHLDKAKLSIPYPQMDVHVDEKAKPPAKRTKKAPST